MKVHPVENWIILGKRVVEVKYCLLETALFQTNPNQRKAVFKELFSLLKATVLEMRRIKYSAVGLNTGKKIFSHIWNVASIKAT